jgi:hypothetical protein
MSKASIENNTLIKVINKTEERERKAQEKKEQEAREAEERARFQEHATAVIESTHPAGETSPSFPVSLTYTWDHLRQYRTGGSHTQCNCYKLGPRPYAQIYASNDLDKR